MPARPGSFRVFNRPIHKAPIMRYRIKHTTQYAYAHPVAVCHNLVRLTPRSTALQRRDSYRLIILPEPAEVVPRRDALGNEVEHFSIHEPHHGLSLSATSQLVVSPPADPGAGPPWEQVRDALQAGDFNFLGPDRAAPPLQFAFASKLVPRAPELAAYALASFTPSRPIVDALRDFNARIHADFEYDPRATTVATPVLQAFAGRAGVCQDFAHVAIACLRSIGLAARYVSGYLRTLPPPGQSRLVGADASHAWLALYCGTSGAAHGDSNGHIITDDSHDGWVDIDPTNNTMATTDHVTLALGRDYADVAPIQGVYVGGGEHALEVSVDVAPL